MMRSETEADRKLLYSEKLRVVPVPNVFCLRKVSFYRRHQPDGNSVETSMPLTQAPILTWANSGRKLLFIARE